MFKFLSRNMNTYAANSNAMASFSCNNSDSENMFGYACADFSACAFLFLLAAVILNGFVSAVIIRFVIISIIAVIIITVITKLRINALKESIS